MEPIEPGDWDALNAGMQKMARVINNLRRRVAELEEAAPASASSPVEVPGFTPSPLCAQCGNRKEPGRLTLTCETCSSLRNTIITTRGSDRTPIMRSDCFNCGKTTKPSTRILCSPCSPLFKAWKDAQ